MSVKGDLRKLYRKKRRDITDKPEKDAQICEEIICSDFYLFADKVLAFASTDEEINTDVIIRDALMLGKTVALPVCKDDKGNMDFYVISSFSDLKEGFWGIREPDTEKCEKLSDFEKSICIVPALAFDKRGYRLGYGRGYYDIFLDKYKGATVGVCYREFVCDELPVEEHDMAVDYLITQYGLS